ncbi:ubiquitin elongating factor core-domain-containing protein [Xylariales sp. AK1849]|nr:ubiquitin elongating factor core-domain-containing protein [Xylariales sp. AK1849]
MDPNEQPEPTLPPAEQMRQKRLAMLNRMNAASPTPSTESQPSSSSASTPKVASPPPNNENKPPAAIPTQRSATHNAPAPNRTNSQLGVKNMASSEADPAPPAKKIHSNTKEETIEDWSDRILGEIFRITLDQSRTQSVDGRVAKTYLPNTSEEAQQSGQPLTLSVQNIDSAILEATSKQPSSKPLLNYLLPCYKRTVRAASSLRRPTAEKQAVLDEAKRLCMSNCIFALTMPEFFSRAPNPNHDTLVPYLLRHHDNEDGVCLEFFDDAVARIKEDESVAPIFTDAMIQLSSKLATMSMNDDYKPYVNCLVTYARYPPLLEALAQESRFLVTPTTNMTKEQIAVSSETETILGPFFRISPLQAEVTKTYFANPRTIDPGHVKTSQSALQMTLKTHQGDLTSIINAFVRASQASRNRVLDWYAFIMNTNHKRRALHLDPKHVASDGFMVNVTATLDQLCEPFMDASFSKISKIDIDYLRRNPRVDMSDETKLNADQATSDAFYSKTVDGTSNFISEVFFLNLAAHHYGSEATNSKLKDLDKEIKHLQRVEKEITEQMKKLSSNPVMIAQAKRQHDRVVSVIEKTMALRFSIEGVLTDKGMQTLSLQFMRYVTVWLLRVASGSAYVPGQKLQLPLPAEKPNAFSCLPEYALQDVVDNFKFVLRFMPQIMMSAVGDEIVALAITFLRSSEYIKNPYLKSSLVTVLYAGQFQMFHLSRGILGDILVGSEFANEHLLHALMKFYIECERGTSSAFYDKFNIRYEIFQVIKTIWPNNVYKEQLSKESKVNRAFFVQFVSLLLGDATYLLDEAMGKLVKIHDHQKQLQDQLLSQEDREKLVTDLEQAEGQCQSYMSLVNETMAMMKLFTETLKDAFTMPEIVGRLADMLDYNLDTLVGPKRGNLKVEDAKKYNFDAKTLLSEFIDIYLNLEPKTPFIEAVAADGRSYKPANFDEASKILSSKGLKSPEELAVWSRLKQKVKEAKEIADQAELDLGDIPGEFEDPLMGMLMTDPVVLPSKNIVDRSTIVQQLLANPLDPFTRNPMTIDDVVPADDLRQQIDAWKAERIAAARAVVAKGDAMDTSAG